MKFSTCAVFAFLASSAQAFTAPQPMRATTTALHQSSATESETSSEADATRQMRKKDDRLRMMKSEQFHRKGFKEVREKVEDVMNNQFKSDLVEQFKENNYVIERDGVKVYLAKVCSIVYIYCVVYVVSVYVMWMYGREELVVLDCAHCFGPYHSLLICLGLWLLLGCRTFHCLGVRGRRTFPRQDGPHYQRIDSQPRSQ